MAKLTLRSGSTIKTAAKKVVVKKAQKPLIELNKINSKIVEASKELSTWSECTDLGLSTAADTTDYRNRLLKGNAGRRVSCKGYVVEEARGWNYTVALVEIRTEEGYLIDTLQHVNVYADLLANHTLPIGGRTIRGEGKYEIEELSSNLRANISKNTTFTKCEEVEFEGIVYEYAAGKWSVGTQRQVEYAANRR